MSIRRVLPQVYSSCIYCGVFDRSDGVLTNVLSSTSRSSIGFASYSCRCCGSRISWLDLATSVATAVTLLSSSMLSSTNSKCRWVSASCVVPFSSLSTYASGPAVLGVRGATPFPCSWTSRFSFQEAGSFRSELHSPLGNNSP